MSVTATCNCKCTTLQKTLHTCKGQQSASKALPAGPAIPRKVREKVVRRQGLQTEAHGSRLESNSHWSAALSLPACATC